MTILSNVKREPLDPVRPIFYILWSWNVKQDLVWHKIHLKELCLYFKDLQRKIHSLFFYFIYLPRMESNYLSQLCGKCQIEHVYSFLLSYKIIFISTLISYKLLCQILDLVRNIREDVVLVGEDVMLVWEDVGLVGEGAGMVICD